LALLYFKPLNSEINPICHLLALLGSHHVLHISWLRVKVRHFPCLCGMHNEGNAVDNAQFYSIDHDSGYMFRLCKVAFIRLLISEV